MGITPHDFKGFKYGTTSYEVAVPEDTETVEVYAKTQDGKAKVTGTGKKTLEKGENQAQVVVTAEDGTTKTYTINIIRVVEQETQDTENSNNMEETDEGNGLSELKINDLKLSPEFKTDIYEYKTKYIGENTKLNIEAKATQEKYVVEIIGNDNLQEGENFITILVSEENGENVATYQVTVNKSLVDEEAIAKEAEEKKKSTQKIIIGVVVGIVAIIAIIVIVIKIRKRNIKLEEEYSGRILYNTDDDYEDEIPKALRGRRFKEDDDFEDEELEDDDMEEEEVEENFEKMPKDKLKEKFLNGYDSNNTDIQFDFEDNRYQNNRRKAKHKGKRFK